LSRVRKSLDIAGIVQGVGFRPTVYHLAQKAGLAGWIQNRAGTVRLVIEGNPTAIENFVHTLPSSLPPNARLDSLTVIDTSIVSDCDALPDFRIVDSHGGTEIEVVIPADLAVCPECMAEILQRGNRRYGYPFATCTNCGPRYTVVNSTPYDRERTTLSVFPMCADCRREYENPADRRFHAETIACPRCGPQLWLQAPDGQRIPGDPLRTARQEMARGKIVAVRGIGGFLLAADAFNRDTIRRLRERKKRPHKPLAIMGRNLDVLRQYGILTPETERVLLSPESPIVILDVRNDAVSSGTFPLDLLSPDTGTIGVMLPTAPLHRLLFESLEQDPTPAFDLLIMTSGNHLNEPICIRNDEAQQRLHDVADLLLCHDREINLRNDDSLCIIQRGATQIWRRARGYAPAPIHLQHPLARCVLAMGAEIKNTVALGFDNKVVLSPHLGDLETPEALEGLDKVVCSLPAFLDRQPKVIAVDLHPDMHSTLMGWNLAAKLAIPVVEIQHHHAHAVAALAEHGHDRGLALVYDGTGLGTDGSIWGAELLQVSPDGYCRLATFSGVPLPGGDTAVREPARQIIARWITAGINVSTDWIESLGMTQTEVEIVGKQCREAINCPTTHAAGRVFDAFSALLGFAPRFTTYEGQSAIRLEAAARRHSLGAIPEIPFASTQKGDLLSIDWSPAFSMLAERRIVRNRETAWAMAVHHAVAAAATAMVEYALMRTQERRIVLTGGVFMNRILTDLLVPALEKRSLEVLIHRQIPPNDGCIALGQAIVGGRDQEC
jgi:hydrogenase maturation protein HypF